MQISANHALGFVEINEDKEIPNLFFFIHPNSLVNSLKTDNS